MTVIMVVALPAVVRLAVTHRLLNFKIRLVLEAQHDSRADQLQAQARSRPEQTLRRRTGALQLQAARLPVNVRLARDRYCIVDAFVDAQRQHQQGDKGRRNNHDHAEEAVARSLERFPHGAALLGLRLRGRLLCQLQKAEDLKDGGVPVDVAGHPAIGSRVVFGFPASLDTWFPGRFASFRSSFRQLCVCTD